MEFVRDFDFWITFASRFFTIGAASIAIYVYFANRDKISSAIKLLMNYSKQLTLSELYFKIERLNELTTNDVAQKKEIINILSEIEGQITGNRIIKSELESQIAKIKYFIENSRMLTEPKKRSLVSELRERIRNIDVSNYKNNI